MKSLRAKMTILIALVVLISSGLLLMFNYRRAMNSMSAQIENNYSLAADKYAQELTALINKYATMIDTLSVEIMESRLHEKSHDEFHKYLEESFEYLNEEGYLYDIYYTYPDNTMACASDFVVDGSMDYVHDREWYYVAAETHKLYYSTPYLDSDSGLPIVTISKAVYVDGEMQGTIAADIIVDILEQIIGRAEVEPDSYAFLIDQNMGMIVHPNDAYSFNDKPLGVLDITDAQYEEVISNIMSNSKKTVYLTDYDGVTRGIVVSRMENTGWYVGFATSKDEIMRGAGELIRGFVIAAIIAVILGGIFAFFIAFIFEKMTRQQQEYDEKVLRLEKKAADEANNAKSAFLADMSHEIRTPINAILGMNEMIMRETDEAQVLDYAKNIKSSGNSLLQLVNSILDFSKIEGGKMEIVPVKYSTKTMVNYVRNSIKERAAAKNLELITHIDPELPKELYGDDVRIEQIILNLLSNAVKYTPSGSVTFTLKALEKKDDTVQLYAEVADTGIGIKEEDMGRLFESFERLDTVKNRNIEGTGLGMSITTKLLHLMDSELKVKSKYGEGSVFYFSIWQKIEDPEPMGEYKESGESGQNTENLHGYRESFRAPKARILVADDTRMNLTVVINLLKTTGINIDTADNGEEALKLSEQTKYDVILLDQRMPGMDGVETLKAMRAQVTNKNTDTPVICLTADAIRGARDRYISEGFTDYLTKPVEGESLEKMLLEYLPEEKVEKAENGEVQEDDSKAGKLRSDMSSGSKTGKSVSGMAQDIKSDGKDGIVGITDEITDTMLDNLKKAGIDTAAGLTYCMDDMEFYQTILLEFARDYTDRAEKLNTYKKDKNWKNYAIQIHSVKSSARTIGAKELAAEALALEKAATDEKEAEIEKLHDAAMELYKETVRSIRT